MTFKKLCQQVNFFEQCRKYNLPLWQCPSFLFILTGVVTLITMISAYLIALRYTQPEAVALIVIAITVILLVIDYLIVQGFEKLAQANQMKSEFVSIVSHQLRTPLTGIKWTINLLLDKQFPDTTQLSERQKEQIVIIRENNQRMINLVNDLLSISRVEQGKLGLKPTHIELPKILHELHAEYQELAKASNLKIQLETEENLPTVFMDRQEIELVLRNLLDNAVRYSRPGGTVKAALKKRANFIRCEITDRGVGIPQEDQNKIFQKFFRSRNILKYQTEGTGLGLFLAKGVVENAKGRINFYSEENKGSTFWFELPIK